MTLPPCTRCGGSGRVPDEPICGRCGTHLFCVEAPEQPPAYYCPACKGDGTQIRADLELMADAMAIPSVSAAFEQFHSREEDS